MTSARRVRRPFGAVFGLGLAVGIGVSCANGEPTNGGNHEGAGATAGATSAGTTGAGMSHGGMSTGGNASVAGGVSVAGAANTAGSAGTGTGGEIGAVGGSGGNFTSGGMSGSGAATGLGGAGNGSSGSASGGASGSGPACSDLPPNNGDSCENAVAFGWCTQSWLGDSCQKSCGKCTGGGAGGSAGSGAGGSAGSGNGSGGSGNSGNVSPPPDINGGQNAWASRYWDCCKPACGWTGNTGGRTPMKACSKDNQPLGDNNAKNACESGGSAFACWSDRPWSVGDKLAYGFAAASGSNYVCGRCYHVQFTGSSHNGGMNAGAAALNGKHMIIQVVNNGGVAADQFDLLIPGGGVGALNACSNQWGSSDLGAQYGGFLAGCNGDLGCVRNKCSTIFGDKPDLMEGCEWFLGWFQAADNPNFKFERIACPAEITQRSGLTDPG